MMDHKKILIVDDDRFVREMVKVILTGAGYDVLVAEDGQAALEMAKAHQPDLVLTDGLLPKLHGFEVCKALKALVQPPKVIILTGVYTKPTYRWQLTREYGADAVLNKPVDANHLLECIAKHLAAAAELTSPWQPNQQPILY